MKLKARVSIIIISIFIFITMYLLGYKILISKTKSLPYTVILLTPAKKYDTGTMVTFKYTFKNYFNYSQGTNFTKIIGCSQGETIERKNDNFYCNNHFLGTAIRKDGTGKIIESVYLNEVIPKGKFFMIGTNPKSYDSKYFGYVDEKEILGVSYGIF
jgi:conjugal transfer pilin signal peptidase TrbI